MASELPTASQERNGDATINSSKVCWLDIQEKIKKKKNRMLGCIKKKIEDNVKNNTFLLYMKTS